MRSGPRYPRLLHRRHLLGGASAWALLGPGLVRAAPKPGTPPVFPRDHGAHLESAIEWWYITGALRDEREREYGFQITFFRTRTPLADRSPAPKSRLAATHLLFAHAALTDVQAGKLLHAERLVRWNGREGERASVHDTDLRIGNWTLRREDPASTYRGQWSDQDSGFGLALELQTTQPVLLQGERGYSRKSPRPQHASLYYSQPQLSTRGELTLRGQKLQVSGRAWLDHEWSQALLDPQAVGWDWVGLNLDDGSALTVFRLRREDGSTLWAGGSLRRPGMAVRAFEPQEVHMAPGRRWRSPTTGASYPVEWALDTPAGRHRVRAVVDAQELDSRASTGTVYWEGLSMVLDAQGQRVGAGYLEMTGYAQRLRL